MWSLYCRCWYIFCRCCHCCCTVDVAINADTDVDIQVDVCYFSFLLLWRGLVESNVTVGVKKPIEIGAGSIEVKSG